MNDAEWTALVVFVFAGLAGLFVAIGLPAKTNYKDDE
jgi:hypothetical protein